jgi:threonine/homoserine/homoserine lactone efflux protein
MHIGRVIGTAFAGLFFMVFVSFDLVLFGVLALGSTVITVLLVLGLLAGGFLGWLAGNRRARHATPPPPTLAMAAGSSLPPPPPPPA